MSETTLIEVPNELLEPLAAVFRHYVEAKTKHPVFPTDLIYQSNLIAEEMGEAAQNANDGNIGLFRHEVGQTAAVALRTLIHLQNQ